MYIHPCHTPAPIATCAFSSSSPDQRIPQLREVNAPTARVARKESLNACGTFLRPGDQQGHFRNKVCRTHLCHAIHHLPPCSVSLQDNPSNLSILQELRKKILPLFWKMRTVLCKTALTLCASDFCKGPLPAKNVPCYT
jgi:hypothetical protein